MRFWLQRSRSLTRIADLCEQVGADVRDVARGIGLDNRIGAKFLHAGPGFGGSCFPKNVRALIKTAHDRDVSLRLVKMVATVNDARKRAMARKVSAVFGGNLRGKIVGVLGLTFKQNTDDMREAPSVALIAALQDKAANVRVFDPAGMDQAKSLLENVEYCESAYDCADGADALVIATEWEQFRALDLDRLHDCMACPVVVDLRNIYQPTEMQVRGVHLCLSWPCDSQRIKERACWGKHNEAPRNRRNEREAERGLEEERSSIRP